MGATAGMLAGIVATLVYISGTMVVLHPRHGNAANNPENWFMGVSPEAFGSIGAVINFIVAAVVSWLTPAPPEHIQHLVEDIRVPASVGSALQGH